MDLGAPVGALVHGVQNIEVAFGYDRPVLEIEIEHVSEQEHGGARGNARQKVDEQAATIGFAITATVPEVRVREKEDLGGGDICVRVHRWIFEMRE
jgi:hypothetical protein